MTYFFTTEEIEEMVAQACAGLHAESDDSTGSSFEMVGSATIVERPMVNNKEEWGCTRRFVQGSWKKVMAAKTE